MRKFLIVCCFLSCAFVDGITRDEIVKNAGKFDFGFFSAQEYAKDMCEMSVGHEKSKMEKLYNEKFETLEEGTLNQSFFNVIKIIEYWQKRNNSEKLNCAFSSKKQNKISKAYENPNNYKTENLEKLNGLMFLSCLQNEVFNVTDDDDGLQKKITDTVLKKSTKVLEHEDIAQAVIKIEFTNEAPNNLQESLNKINKEIEKSGKNISK